MITMAEAMLQIKCSNGVGYNSSDQTEEISVTQPQYKNEWE